VLIRLVSDAAEAGYLDTPEHVPSVLPASPDAERDIARLSGGVLAGVPTEAVTRCLAARTQLFGFVSFELFGHLVGAVDGGAVFDRVAEDVGAFVRFTSRDHRDS
jgi:hypothetical protein